MKKKLIITTIILVVIFILLISIYFLYIFNIIPHKKYTSEYFNIETVTSNVDMDEDGIDDQTDILNEALKYVSTKPKYKSAYYAAGYPDDGYGVCTDVVDFALLNSGYDIRELLNEDVKNNRNEYNIDIIDKNIDFRRVSNLYTYFLRNAISLTTDIYDINSWSGGDIVVFKTHIGIISNNRNYKGINFVIHHASKNQINYEEDILELYKDEIIGHFRIS